jgi:hypothetical protein
MHACESGYLWLRHMPCILKMGRTVCLGRRIHQDWVLTQLYSYKLCLGCSTIHGGLPGMDACKQQGFLWGL